MLQRRMLQSSKFRIAALFSIWLWMLPRGNDASVTIARKGLPRSLALSRFKLLVIQNHYNADLSASCGQSGNFRGVR
ncbi:hypothetical protein C0V76_00330 [Uliginosibacterium sp. TH139]|jgi:hypothetical protein|nr:hypothetical protein C0V76_00330 [Uliginosibacterium sp. TH139]